MYKIEKDFFKRNPLDVCNELVGCIIKRNFEDGTYILARITEIEAYLGINDKAAHTYNNRKTNRTKTMYLDGGTMYIYFIYGMYYNLNFITDTFDIPTGILLRGVDIIEGHDIASYNRYKKPFNQLTKSEKKNLSNGPGKVCIIYNIDKRYDGLHYENIFEFFRPAKNYKSKYQTTPRINIDYAGDDKYLPYRFLLDE